MKNKLSPPQRPELNTEKTRFISLNSFEKYQMEKKNWKLWTTLGSAFTIALSLSLFFLLGNKENNPVLTPSTATVSPQIKPEMPTPSLGPQNAEQEESEAILRAPASEQEEAHMEDYVEGEEQFYDVVHEDQEGVMKPPLPDAP